MSPKAAFGDGVISSVDKAIVEEARHKREAQRSWRMVFKGSEKVEPADKGDEPWSPRELCSVEELRTLMQGG